MVARTLRRLIDAAPFRPFTVYLPGGRGFNIPHTDFAALSPTGRTLIVFRRDDAFDILGVPLITRIQVHDGRKAAA